MNRIIRAGVLGGWLGWSGAAAAQEPPDAMTATARELYEAGADAAAAKDWATCHAKLTAAWAVTKHHQVAAQLGMCELELGLHPAAAEHLAHYLAHAPAETPAEQKSYARELYDRAATEIAIVVCGQSFAGAEVRVDGGGAGSGPITLYLKPGEHALEANRQGERWSARIHFEAGEKRELTVTLTSGEEKPVVDEGPSMLVLGVGYGLGAVATAVGIGLTVAAAGKDGDVDDLAATLDQQGSSCPEGSPEPICAELYDAADARGALSAGAGFAWGLAGAALAGTTIYWIASGSSEPSSALAIDPRLGPAGGGVWLRGAY